jgi:hypothetical protein
MAFTCPGIFVTVGVGSCLEITLIAAIETFGQDREVEAGTLRFEVDKPKINWGAFGRNAVFRTRERAGVTTAGQWESYSAGRPSVVACNSSGEKRVLEVANTVREARERATTIEQDYKTLNIAQWCARYDVPPSFVSG